MPFLFTKTMAERALEIQRFFENNCDTEVQAVVGAEEAYDFFCQQNGGLAYLASFLPWCEAFKARMLLSETVDALSKKLIQQLSDPEDETSAPTTLERTTLSLLLRGPILGAILSLPFQILAETKQRHIDGYAENNKDSWVALVSVAPIIADIANFKRHTDVRGHTTIIYENLALKKEDKLANLLHTLCNPVRLVEQTLQFLHVGANRLIEIGGQRGESGPGRKFAKGIVAALFTVVALPVILVSAIADIPYQVVKNGIYEPLKFIATAVKQNDNKVDGTILNAQEAQKMNTWLNETGSTPTPTLKEQSRRRQIQKPDNWSYVDEEYPQEFSSTRGRGKGAVLIGCSNNQHSFFTAPRAEVQMAKELARVARDTTYDQDEQARDEKANKVIQRYRPGAGRGSSDD